MQICTSTTLRRLLLFEKISIVGISISLLIHGCQRWQTFSEMANRVQLTIAFFPSENVWPSVKYWTHNGEINLFLCKHGSFCCPEIIHCCQSGKEKISDTKKDRNSTWLFISVPDNCQKGNTSGMFVKCAGIQFKSVHQWFDCKEKA